MIKVNEESTVVSNFLQKKFKKRPDACKVAEVFNPPTMDCLNFYRVQTLIGGALGNILVMEFNGKATRFYIEC